ncbi:DEAD/DEAH box helicase [Phormidium sp. FACHB-592]|uniref:DEAD/DEAH box helicase n=1 Tax=Stenomitos frigidus AS-A4 TaxID=2933935 RepID=A0ABV0KTH6_9CYAN|nr:DEAD/DEAH box helicase [Phormidium sp. FACHB-592]MBD2072409.1 DEAD/DEAH box helicase [Phormidium sp. FACHB-592]
MTPTATAHQYRVRDYQETLIQNICQQWQQGQQRVLAQLPTGGGKTIIAGAIASSFTCRDETVLFLAHREELLTQAASKIGQIAAVPVGIIKAGYQPNLTAPIQVASVQSMVNRLSLFPDPALVITDESHHATASGYRKIYQAYPDAYQLGITATPIRLDGSGFEDLFDTLVCGPSVSQLIEQGYLSQFKLFADPSPMTTKGARISGGDWSAGDVAAENNIVELSGSLIRSYQQHCPGKRCLVFTINVEHSQAIAWRYNQAGIPACHLDGETPTVERKDAIARFAAGELKVLSNCALFDEGLDIPGIDAVQIAKPTKSLSKWLQMVGRALRPAAGKEFATILDHTKNWTIHGLPTRPRVWTLEGVEVRQDIRAKANESGEVTEEPIALEIIESDNSLEAISVTPLDEYRAVLDDLIRKQQQRHYNLSWVYYKLLELKPPLEIWQEYARMRGYRPGWAWFRFQEQLKAIGGQA